MSTYHDYEAERTLAAFAMDPIGWTVELADGTEADVLDVLDGDYGRYLKLDQRRGWLHLSQIAGVVVWSVRVNPEYRGPSSSAKVRTGRGS